MYFEISWEEREIKLENTLEVECNVCVGVPSADYIWNKGQI